MNYNFVGYLPDAPPTMNNTKYQQDAFWYHYLNHAFLSINSDNNESNTILKFSQQLCCCLKKLNRSSFRKYFLLHSNRDLSIHDILSKKYSLDRSQN